jgi:branched-chain amino acid transport system substrate-binding protein
VALGGTPDGKAVTEKMKATPTDDVLFGKGEIDAAGRKRHDAYLFEVKKPSESKYPGDFYHLKATIPASEAFRQAKDSGCPLVKS